MRSINVIGKSRQGDGTQHIEVTAPAGTPVEEVVEAIMAKFGYHEEAEAWGEVVDEGQPDTWTYHLSVTP